MKTFHNRHEIKYTADKILKTLVKLPSRPTRYPVAMFPAIPAMTPALLVKLRTVPEYMPETSTM